MSRNNKTAASVTELGPAIGEVRQACEELGNEAHRSPFFIIVGAGISYPPVPLAASIIEHCKQVAQRYNREATDDGGPVLDNYSTWFGRAYPAAKQRQQYLRSLIDKKPLSLASLRLAHLLSARRFTNVVVTTNFDDFISRALRLFGEEPAICDHPRTIGRIDRDLRDIQIVHVHGSYLFYDLANLRGEVTARARQERDTSFTMMGLLDSLLWARSPLVVGYSGWEGDIIMSALRRRLRGGNPLAQSIYWFCYRRSDLDLLPGWLRQSPDVRFVLPPAATDDGRAISEERSATGERPPEPTLPAYEVFDQLNESFEVGEPPIFQNPVKYFAQTLQSALPDSDGAGDPYSFKTLIERLNKAAATFEVTTRPSSDIEVNLDKLRGLMRESNYRRAARLLADLLPARLSELDAAGRTEVLKAARLAGTSLLSKQRRKMLDPELARVAIFDPVIDRMLGDLPSGTVWCVASRSDQLGSETTVDKKQHGAFTASFVTNLGNAELDQDKDGKISVLECVLAVAAELAQNEATPQIPVVSGDADRIALFASKRRSARPYGALHALLVGVAKHKSFPSGLSGPPNDIAALTSVLKSTERRLFAELKLRVLQDEEATRAAVTRAVKGIVANAKKDDLLFVYFSGHGSKTQMDVPTSEPDVITLILYDFEGKNGVLSSRELTTLLAGSKARDKLIVLDF